MLVHLLSGFKAHPHLKHETPGEGGCPFVSLLLRAQCPRLWAPGSCSETWVNTRQHEKAGQRRGPCQTRSTELPSHGVAQGGWPRPAAESRPACAVGCFMSLRPTCWAQESCPQAYAPVSRVLWTPFWNWRCLGPSSHITSLFWAVGASFKGQVCFSRTGTLPCPPE